MWEATILYTATIEILSCCIGEGNGGAILLEVYSLHLLNNLLTIAKVGDSHQTCAAVEAHTYLSRCNCHVGIGRINAQPSCALTWVIEEDTCWRITNWITNDTTLWVAKKAKYILTIEVYCHHATVAISNLYRCWIDLSNTTHCLSVSERGLSHCQ